MWFTLKKLINILAPADQKKLLIVFILVLLMAMIESAGVISIMPFLAVLANPLSIENNKMFHYFYVLVEAESQQQFIVYLGVISLAIVVFSAFFKILTQYSLNQFSSLQRHELSSRLLEIYLQKSYIFFIQRNSAELVKNILSEVDQLVWGIIQPALLFMSYGIVLMAMVAILIVYDPIMAISTAVLLSGFYLIIYWIIKNKLDQIGASFAHSNEQRYQSCQEALGGIKDVIINNAQQGYLDYFKENSLTYAKHLATRDTLAQVPRYVIEAVGYGCLIILAIFLVISGRDVSHILPLLGLYGFAAYRMLPAAQNIYQSIAQIRFSEPVFNRISKEFNLARNSLETIGTAVEQPLQFKREIRLEQVTFAYPSRVDQPVLKNFNLTIAKNRSVGIVGKSGSGKSTLMDIMLGLLCPQQGKIYIDDVELTPNNMEAWQAMVGYVPQSIYLADKSIAENIAFGVPPHEMDWQAIRIGAQRAQLDTFITQQLPDGYNTVVGERGVMLSGGQRQRIGIARALYKNPQVLFMDEATSALDAETEQAVNEAIQQLSGEKTIVIIAHRESAVTNCSTKVNLGNY